MASLEFHAAAIQAAIDSAAKDLCFLDDGSGGWLGTVELNQEDEHGDIQGWIKIDIPDGDGL